MDCKRPTCCCFMASTIGVIVLLIAIATTIHVLDGNEPTPSGGTGSINEMHKSIVEQISLLNLANKSGGDDGISWTWPAGAILILSVLGIGYYVYHRKIKLPRRRQNRELARDQQVQDERQRQFIMNLMNSPSPN